MRDHVIAPVVLGLAVALGTTACVTSSGHRPLTPAPTPSPTGTSCWGGHFDPAPNAVGAATADEALADFLKHSAPDGFPRAVAQWQHARHQPLMYTAGTARVAVVHLRSPARGYLVMAASNC